MVTNFTDLLNKEYGSGMDKEASEYMRFILESARHMQILVSDLLEYSRVDSEESNPKNVDCRSHTDLAIANLQEIIEETHARITVGELPTIHANPVRFSRLMQNLIGNAIKYRREGTVPEISIMAEDKGHEWLFSVRDNGIGMKEEYLEQIFVIFKRLHGKKDYKGTGIGLAVCKKIVDSFGGSIWAESTLGEGSTFHFTIPKKDSPEKAV